MAYFDELSDAAKRLDESLSSVEDVYQKHLSTLGHIVDFEEKTDWREFSEKEKLTTENAILRVGLLYSMCKVKLVLKGQDKDELNSVNVYAVNAGIREADKVLSDIGSAI